MIATLNFHHLRYFWAVAHDGSLTRAAKRMHVSPSALSVQIAKLEDDLGHALFERRRKQLVLTEPGRIALTYADAIFGAGSELLAVLGGGAARRVLRVGALATLSRNFQLRFLSPLVGKEDVELIVRSGSLSDMLRALEAHNLDVVLANVAPPRDAASPFLPHALAEQPVSLVGRPKRRRPRRLAAVLATEPVVVPTMESSIRTGFDALVDRLGVRPRIAAEVDDMAMLRLLARTHGGLAVVPRIVVKDELEQGVLVEVARLPELVETFFAITLARRFPNPLLEKLLTRSRSAKPPRGGD